MEHVGDVPVVVRFLAIALAIGVALAGIGAIVAAAAGRDFEETVASALFIGGAVLLIGNVMAGGSTLGQRADIMRAGLVHGSSKAFSTPMPFGWALVGLFQVGLGVLVVIAV